MNPATIMSALNGAAPDVATTRHAQLTKQARTLVSQTFFGTLLKQMRESPFKDEMFSGGRGGEAFGSMYDQHLAEHMARGAGKKLVNAIVKRFEAKQPLDQYDPKTVAPAASAASGSFSNQGHSQESRGRATDKKGSDPFFRANPSAGTK